MNANQDNNDFSFDGSIPHSPTSDEEYLSDYIQNHRVPLPQLNSDDSNDDYVIDDEYQSIASNGTESDWQENWLFKKKKSKNEGIVTASSIGMLVPSPTEEVKALIGDKTADEISDLSEAGSDIESDLSDKEMDDDEDEKNKSSLDIPHVLVESKTLIGGKNEMDSFAHTNSVNDLLQPDSLVSVQSLSQSSPIIMEAKNEMIFVNVNNQNDNILTLVDTPPQTPNNQFESIQTNFIVNAKNENEPKILLIDDELIKIEVFVKPTPEPNNNLLDEPNDNITETNAPVPAPRFINNFNCFNQIYNKIFFQNYNSQTRGKY